MRSTTCTDRSAPCVASRLRRPVLGLCLALLALPAQAAPPQGCYARTYDAAHLAANPDQVVAAMSLSFDYDPAPDFALIPPGSFGAAISVVLAGQGHVARDKAPDEGYPDGFGGASMHNVLLCADDGSSIRCRIDCDAGGFQITRHDDTMLEFRTDYLVVGMGQACGGFTDLAERPGEPVTYRLSRAPDAACLEE